MLANVTMGGAPPCWRELRNALKGPDGKTKAKQYQLIALGLICEAPRLAANSGSLGLVGRPPAEGPAILRPSRVSRRGRSSQRWSTPICDLSP